MSTSSFWDRLHEFYEILELKLRFYECLIKQKVGSRVLVVNSMRHLFLNYFYIQIIPLKEVHIAFMSAHSLLLLLPIAPGPWNYRWKNVDRASRNDGTSLRPNWFNP